MIRTTRQRQAIYVETPCPLGIPGRHRRFVSGHLSTIVSWEPSGPGGSFRWHMSVSHRDRYPTWDEIADARYQLLPEGVTMAMLLPPTDEYINLHPNCFHLWEMQSERRPGAEGWNW